MLAKYVFCILTIEWAVLGMRLLKGKGRSYERIRNDVRFVRIYKERREWLSITFGAFLLLNGRNERNRSRQPTSWLTCKNGAETFNPRRFHGSEK